MIQLAKNTKKLEQLQKTTHLIICETVLKVLILINVSPPSFGSLNMLAHES